MGWRVRYPRAYKPKATAAPSSASVHCAKPRLGGKPAEVGSPESNIGGDSRTLSGTSSCEIPDVCAGANGAPATMPSSSASSAIRPGRARSRLDSRLKVWIVISKQTQPTASRVSQNDDACAASSAACSRKTGKKLKPPGLSRRASTRHSKSGSSASASNSRQSPRANSK